MACSRVGLNPGGIDDGRLGGDGDPHAVERLLDDGDEDVLLAR